MTRVYQYTIVMSLQPPFGDANKTCCKLLWGMGILTHQDSTQTVGWILGFPCRWKRLQYSMFIVEVLLACAQEVCLLGIFLHIFTNIFLFDQYIYRDCGKPNVMSSPSPSHHHWWNLSTWWPGQPLRARSAWNFWRWWTVKYHQIMMKLWWISTKLWWNISRCFVAG